VMLVIGQRLFSTAPATASAAASTFGASRTCEGACAARGGGGSAGCVCVCVHPSTRLRLLECKRPLAAASRASTQPTTRGTPPPHTHTHPHPHPHTSFSSRNACRQSSNVGNVLVGYVSLYTSTFLAPGPHVHSPRRALVPPMSPVMMVCTCSGRVRACPPMFASRPFNGCQHCCSAAPAAVRGDQRTRAETRSAHAPAHAPRRRHSSSPARARCSRLAAPCWLLAACCCCNARAERWCGLDSSHPSASAPSAPTVAACCCHRS
jgi:hypothetical protein